MVDKIGLLIFIIFAGIIIFAIRKSDKTDRNTARSHASADQQVKDDGIILPRQENSEKQARVFEQKQETSATPQKPDEKTEQTDTPEEAISEENSIPALQSKVVERQFMPQRSSNSTTSSSTMRPSVGARPNRTPQPRVNSQPERQKDMIRIVLLTDSVKFGGACVSGFDPQTRRFVRFVSDAATGKEIPFSELRGIKTMDLVEAERVRDCPLGPQSENVLIRPGSIRRIGKYSGTIEDISREIQYSDRLMFSDTVANRLSDVSRFHHSLEIITVQDLVLREVDKYGGGTTTRANFKYNGKCYSDFRVTDFNYDLRKREETKMSFLSADLIISIPVQDLVINGVKKGYYKFVAAIYPKASQTQESTVPQRAKLNRDELMTDYESGMPMWMMEEKYGQTEAELLAIIKDYGSPKHRV